MMMMMMMKPRFRKLMPYVQLMKSASTNHERRGIINTCPNQILDTIVEILYNILHKNVRVRNRKYLLAMNKYRAPLVRMFNLYSKKAKRRSFVRQQSGGFLSAIIPIIASVVASQLL